MWLVYRKRRSSTGGVSLVDAVEEALCFGWIDSRLQPLDGRSSRLLFTPRRPRSAWAVGNKRRVASLTSRGLMTEAGLDVVRAAKRDGSWTSLDAIESLRVPDDLAQALSINQPAALGFASAPPSRKKLWLWAVASAKRPETRSRRIAIAVDEMVRLKRLAAAGAPARSPARAPSPASAHRSPAIRT